MDYSQFKNTLHELFGSLLEQFKEQGECGFNYESSKPISKIGYCTNLTPEMVDQAKAENVNLIVTHHDAWEFVYGMREICVRKLEEYDIGHFFVHLPLDYAEFGTCNSLLKEIGDVTIIQQSHHHNGQSAIGMAELEQPVDFNELVERFSDILAEDIKAWQFGGKKVKRIGMITGAGDRTDCLHSAKSQQCDVYITGEKSLYTVQYAKFIGMNLIVGSHTFTEIFGVKALAHKIKEASPQLELVCLPEEHLE